MIDADLLKPAPHEIRTGYKATPVIGSHVEVKRIPKPEWATEAKQGASQTMGARYERRVEKHLQELVDSLGWELWVGPWLSYSGKIAQPDFVLIPPIGEVIVIECKLTWVDTTNQLALYKALLTNLSHSPVKTCTICRNITPETPPVIHSFTDLEDASVWLVRV